MGSWHGSVQFLLLSLCPGGWVLPRISHIQVCDAPKGMFWGLFGLKMGIHFAHFGLETGMVFESATGAYECSYRFNSR